MLLFLVPSLLREVHQVRTMVGGLIKESIILFEVFLVLDGAKKASEDPNNKSNVPNANEPRIIMEGRSTAESKHNATLRVLFGHQI